MEAFLYSTPQPRRVRTTPMRVICVGLGRSATESLAAALLVLGFDHTYHGFEVIYPGSCEYWTKLGRKKYGGARATHVKDGDSAITRQDFDQMLGHCQAVTDFTAGHFAEELIRAYPEAKVIMNRRKDMDAWYSSMTNTLYAARPRGFQRLLNYFSAETYWRNCIWSEVIDAFYHGDMEATAKWRNREHVAAIRGMGLDETKLLDWTVEDGWEDLCRFLDCKVPEIPFPRKNEAGAFEKKIQALRAQIDERLRRNLQFLSLVLSLLAFLLFLHLSFKVYSGPKATSS